MPAFDFYALFKKLRVRYWLLAFVLLLGTGQGAQAADYYWVGGAGFWNDLNHWATSSGGSTNHAQVPQSTDNVYFDESSFTAAAQTVTIDATVTCFDMDWTGAVRVLAGGTTTGGARLSGGGTVEVNGDLRLTAGLGRQDVNFSLLADRTGHELDLQSVPLNGTLSFDSKTGGWTFLSDVSLVQSGAAPSLLLSAGFIDFKKANVSCSGIRSTGTTYRNIRLGSGVFSLLGPGATWEVGGTNLQLDAGTSTLRLGAAGRSTASGYAFVSSEQVYNAVEVLAGTSASFGVTGSSFSRLTVAGTATFSSPVTILETLTVSRDAIVRAAAGQVVSFAPAAELATSGDCAGLAVLQSSVAGAPATFWREGGWAGSVLPYAAVQDIAFSGGSALSAMNCLDRGNNQGVVFTALPVSDLYWVNGAGNWHDPSHWALSSGGSSVGNSCLPTLATNVHFDANSFTASGQSVTLDGTNAFCRDLNWTGANAPVFRTAATDQGQKQLGIGGSLTFNSSMTLSLAADLVFYGYEAGMPTATVTTAGRVLIGNVYFRAPGATYTLLDALTLAPGATSPNGRLYVEAGTLATNGQNIDAQGFTSGYAATGSVFTTGSGAGGPVSTAAVTVNLGSSLLTLTPASATSDLGARPTYTWDITAATVLNAGSSTIRIGTNSTANQPAYFRAALGKQYNVVSFTDPAALSLPTLVAGDGVPATFAQLLFAGSADINSSNLITQQLGLAPGRAYTFNSTTQTFAPAAQLSAVGDCSGYITLTGTSATSRATFSKPTGGLLPNQLLQVVVLRNLAFGGGSAWEATRSIDQGGNIGVLFTNQPIPRTLYWVGGTGFWTDPNHWASSSGGPGGNCVPSQLDAVLFDGQSFTEAGQVVTQDAVQAACRSISWAAATNAPTFSGLATNRLSVYGSITWNPAMTQALLGETLLLGNSTITSAGQAFAGGLTINAPAATITLADALQQPRTAGSGLTLLAGAFLTNDQPVRVRSILSNPLAGLNPPARTLQLGASTVEITAGNWTITQPASLTFSAGTSTIYLSTGNFFNGNGFLYNRVRLGAGAAHAVGGNSTFATLQMAGVTILTGSNTITEQLILEPGSTFRFGAGTITTLTAAASVQASGTGTRVITLQSTLNGQAFTWEKPAGGTNAGTVCASYIYLRDSRAQGGAYFETGWQANNQGNTTGWSFANLPQATALSQQVCPQLGAHTLRFTFAGLDRLTQAATPLAAAQFPLTVVLRNLTAGTTQTLSVPSATYDLPVPTSTATTSYQVLSVTTNTTSCGSLASTSAFPVVTDGPLNGPAGQWRGTAATPDWLDCQNWASGTVPGSTTDVTIAANTPPATLNGPGAVRSLQLQTGGKLTLGSAADLAVTGNWLNDGATTLDPASQVSFVGSSTQLITNGDFGRVVVDNAAGLLLQTDARTATTLTLRAGRVLTGLYKWWHTNPAAASLTSTGSASYVAGTLRRSLLSGVNATYVFPVGTSTQYARLDLLSSQLSGTSYLDASFGPKTDSDTGLSCTEATPPSALRYLAVYPAGIWTLTPDAQPSVGTYAVQAYLTPFSGLIDNQFGILKRPDNSVAAADWSTGGGTLSALNGPGRLVADGYALRSNLRSFSQFGLGQAEPFTPLPVNLTSFWAVAQGRVAALGWTTAQEVRNEYFEIEVSTNGQTFRSVGRLRSQGTGALARTYSFVDEQFGSYGVRVVYYRLHQVDTDGSGQYSPVRAVMAEANNSFVVYPTLVGAGEPLHYAFGREVMAPLTAGTELLVYTLTGQCVGKIQLPNSESGHVALPALAPGWYVARVQLGSGQTLTASFGVK